MRSHLACVVTVASLIASPALAQTQPPVAPLQVSGSVTSGTQQVSNDSNSSKLSEFRDLSDRFYVPKLTFLVKDQNSGWAIDLSAANVGRRDQTILADAGRPGRWALQAQWVETPHVLSNRAQTPYIDRGAGLFTVPTTVPITFKKLATGGADAPAVVASDALIAAYQTVALHPTALGTQTQVGRFSASWLASETFSIGLAYDQRDKTGSKPTFGPIGDRPPRTLNIQIAEPVDYRTSDVTFSAEHQGSKYQLRAEYLYSDFSNAIDTLRWQNVYTTTAPGAEFDVWDRLVGTYGARPLAPDNRLHNAVLNAGVDVGWNGRLAASASFGRTEQDATLLPYAVQVSALVNKTLPRNSAQAKIRTANYSVDYAATPAARMTIRAFVRATNLTNETPSSQWQYVTSDTANLNGTVSYVNMRVSLPYAADRLHSGAEVTWRPPMKRTSLLIGYERDEISRDFREADTSENRLRLTFRTKPATRLSLQARYLFGVRDGGEYGYNVTREGYWYALGEANDQNNPARTFDNHPDMRRYDVSDRRRQQADFTVTLAARHTLTASAFVRYRSDDFDSDVTSVQPLLGTGLADEQARTPGDQLGRLRDKRLRYGVDLFWQPVPRAMVSAYAGLDRGTGTERSIEFNENNKQNPSAVATATLGPWTRAGNQWTADFTERTVSGGFGLRFDLVPDRVLFLADYGWSLARVDTVYSGFGLTNFDGTSLAPNTEFAFSTPPDVREDLKTLNLGFEIPVKSVTFLVGYRYETYTLDDWQQGANLPWVESVGSEYLLRDTSRSNQWGNRLFNLGTYLAPSYRAHVGWLGLRVGF